MSAADHVGEQFRLFDPGPGTPQPPPYAGSFGQEPYHAPEGQQLSMFEPLKRLRYAADPADYAGLRAYHGEGYTEADMWALKLDEAKSRKRGNFVGQDHMPSLYDRVAQAGIHTPVTLDNNGRPGYDFRLVNGHHRIAAAADAWERDPERLDKAHPEVPVRWETEGRDMDYGKEELQHLYTLTEREKKAGLEGF